jgi:phage terminase small subunit
MPALRNIRHERFARYWMRTGVAAQAYAKAGYETKPGRPTISAASRLLTHVDVQRRIRELRKQMAGRHRITVNTLLQDLADDRALARTLGQPSAAIAATQLTAKLVGLLVDRRERGQPGDFANLQTEEEVLAMVRAELGDASALVLAAQLAKHDRDAERSAAEVSHEPSQGVDGTVSAMRPSAGRGAHH